MTRSKIRRLQSLLTSAGFSPGLVDGIMGPVTEAAVKAFQKANKLSVDGIAGPITMAALKGVVEGISAPVEGVDREAREPAGPVWPHQRDVRAFFGKPGTRQAKCKCPYPMRLAWKKPIVVNAFSCHELVASHMEEALVGALEHYGADGIRELGLDLFGGCLNVRRMQGGRAWSMHSWGIAIDMDPARNRLRWGAGKAEMSKPIYNKWFDLWEEQGFVSLGRARNYDWMHVQAARI